VIPWESGRKAAVCSQQFSADRVLVVQVDEIWKLERWQERNRASARPGPE